MYQNAGYGSFQDLLFETNEQPRNSHEKQLLATTKLSQGLVNAVIIQSKNNAVTGLLAMADSMRDLTVGELREYSAIYM